MKTDRDTIVARGMAAKRKSERSPDQKGPWLYRSKYKNGYSATRSVEIQATSIPHLYAEILMRHANDRQTINIYAINRVMKSGLRSQREDI